MTARVSRSTTSATSNNPSFSSRLLVDATVAVVGNADPVADMIAVVFVNSTTAETIIGEIIDSNVVLCGKTKNLLKNYTNQAM